MHRNLSVSRNQTAPSIQSTPPHFNTPQKSRNQLPKHAHLHTYQTVDRDDEWQRDKHRHRCFSFRAVFCVFSISRKPRYLSKNTPLRRKKVRVRARASGEMTDPTSRSSPRCCYHLILFFSGFCPCLSLCCPPCLLPGRLSFTLRPSKSLDNRRLLLVGGVMCMFACCCCCLLLASWQCPKV